MPQNMPIYPTASAQSLQQLFNQKAAPLAAMPSIGPGLYGFSQPQQLSKQGLLQDYSKKMNSEPAHHGLYKAVDNNIYRSKEEFEAAMMQDVERVRIKIRVESGIDPRMCDLWAYLRAEVMGGGMTAPAPVAKTEPPKTADERALDVVEDLLKGAVSIPVTRKVDDAARGRLKRADDDEAVGRALRINFSKTY